MYHIIISQSKWGNIGLEFGIRLNCSANDHHNENKSSTKTKIQFRDLEIEREGPVATRVKMSTAAAADSTTDSSTANNPVAAEDGSADSNQDSMIIAQKEAIEKEIAQSTPLVGERYLAPTPLSTFKYPILYSHNRSLELNSLASCAPVYSSVFFIKYWPALKQEKPRKSPNDPPTEPISVARSTSRYSLWWCTVVEW